MKMDERFEDDMEMYQKEHREHTGDIDDKDKKHKMMTMEDVANELADDFADEISDCKKYMHMAKVADKSGDYDDCHYLTEMSKDEYTHAYFIHNFMVEHGICIPEEQEKDFECLKEKMKEFF